MRHSGTIDRILALGAALGLALGVAAPGAAMDAAKTAAAPVKWDPEASKELEKALHHMHAVWASGDTKALKSLIPGDDQLVTFELAPANHRPIRLESKEDIDEFVDAVNGFVAAEEATSTFDEPVVNCKATDSFGVCTEECTIHIKKKDGSERVDRLWSTTVAVKYPDGWKWIQWHMSVGTPSQYVSQGSGAAHSH